MKTFRISLLILIAIAFIPANAQAFWVWTPETNKWVNPKYAVKETPAEQLEFALEHYEAKDYKAAIKEFNKLLKHYPRAKEAPESQYYIGLCWEDQKEDYKAYQAYQKVIDRYPFSERSAEIVRRQYDIGERMLEGINQKSAFVKSFSGANYNVIEIFKKVIKNAPYGDLAAPAQYKIGLYLMEQGLFQEARDEFEKTVNDYPDSEWAKAAQYQIAVTDAKRSTDAEYDQKVTKVAVAEFESFLESNPDAELSAEAKEKIAELRNKEAENNMVIAEFYEKQKNFKAAKIYYQIVIDDYNDSSWVQKALNKIQEISQKTE